MTLKVSPHRTPAPARRDDDANSRAAPAPKHPQVTNQGGRVLKNPVLTPIYVGNYWNTPAGAAARSREDAFAQDFGRSGLMGVLHQYGVKSSSFGGSTVVGTDLKPGQVLKDADVARIVKQQMAAFPKTKAARVYTVVLPPGVVIQHGKQRSDRADNTGARLGGYHGSFRGPDGKNVYYAAVTSGTQANGIPFSKSPVDNATIIESHEWAEALTDPDVADLKKPLGYFDTRNQAEVADETQLLLGRQLPHHQIDRSREWTTEDGFAVQKLWSQRDDRFEIAPRRKTK